MEASRAAPPGRGRTSLRQLAPLRLKRSAEPAFEQLYRKHAREVYQYALALLANPADAEDVTQTTFLNAYRAFQRGERPNRPHNWLIAIAHNVCRMQWRQAQSRPNEVALDEVPEPVALEHEHPNLDEVLHALARLSFNQRAALVMRELEGRSYQEIAGVLDVSVGAVEALLFRARNRLRVERGALGLLTTAPLPGSLTSFLGAGGGAAAVGGAAVGADLVLKAAAVVAAGALTAGAGYESLQAVQGPSHTAATSAVTPQAIQAGHPVSARTRHARSAGTIGQTRRVLRRAAQSGRSGNRLLQPSHPSQTPGAAAQSGQSAPAAPAGASPAQTVSSTLGATAPLPVRQPVPLPPSPVTVPAVTVPPLPVTVTTPTLPLPPPPRLP